VSGAVDWVETQEQIDMATLQARDPILFFEEVRLVMIRNYAAGVQFHQKLSCYQMKKCFTSSLCMGLCTLNIIYKDSIFFADPPLRVNNIMQLLPGVGQAHFVRKVKTKQHF
jgi:hypothetical protein